MNRHILNLLACVRYLSLALLFTFYLFRPSDLRSQSLDCREFPIAPVPGDTVLIQTDQNRVVVRVDTTASGEDRTVVNAACVNVNTAGYYRIRTGIRYSSGQANESFYLTLRNAGTPLDSLTTPACPTNAGPYRVLQDVVGDTSVARFNQIRDTGLFYFAAGMDTIILNHYFNIQEIYPFFLNPPGELITRNDIESVHVFQVELKFIAETLDEFGPKLSKQALDSETGAPIETIGPDQTFTYKLTLQNVGPEASRDVILTDILPEHLLIDESSFNLPPSSISSSLDTLVWRFNSLDVGASRELLFKARVNGAAPHPTLPFSVINRGIVTSQCNRDSAAAELLVVAPPVYDLALDKTVSPMSVLAGKGFEYRIRLENLGPDPAANLSIVDVLPEFVEHSDFINPPVDTAATDTLRWVIDSLGVGESREMRYRGVVPTSVELPTAPFVRVNRAEVFSRYDTNADNDTSSAVVTVVNPQYDLSVRKSVSPSSVKRGEVFDYLIVVENGGPASAEDVLLVDGLPEFVRHFNFQNPPLDTTAADTLRWIIDSLGVGESREMRYRGVVPTSVELPTAPFVRVNRAEVFSRYDTNADNDTSSAVVTVVNPQYDLSVRKSVSPSSVKRGEVFDYVMVVENSGPDSAEDVLLVDVVPEFVRHFDFQNPPLDTTATDTLRWSFVSLAAGERVEMRYSGIVSASLDLPTVPFTRTNLATVFGEFDTNPANNTARASVDIVLPDYDLEVVKSVVPGSVKQGEPFSYSITVRNNGPDPAEHVTLWDILPGSVTFSDFRNPPIDTSATDTLRWNLGIVKDGEEREFGYLGVIPTSVDLPEIPFIRTNLAHVRSEFDRDARNDTSSAQVAIIAEEDCIVLSHNVFEPARQELKITFELKRSSQVSLKVYDITGYEVSTLEEKAYNAGTHEFVWNGKTDKGLNVGSGVYLILFRSGTLDCLEKVIVVR